MNKTTGVIPGGEQGKIMKTFEQCCLEVGLNPKEQPPELKTEWVAYVAGKIVPAKSMNEAISISSLYENVKSEQSKLEHHEYFVNRDVKITEAAILFKKYLREEYFNMSDRVYDLCYEEALKDVDVDGHDAIAHRLGRNISLVERVKQRK